MYLIKNIYLDNNTNCVVVEDGIRIAKIKNAFTTRLEVLDSFWGQTQIDFEENFDFSKFNKENQYLLSYVDKFGASKLPGDFRRFTFKLEEDKSEEIEGYIVFAYNQEMVQTDGRILYGRYPNDLVVVLKEGNFIKLCENEIMVVKNKLVLSL